LTPPIAFWRSILACAPCCVSENVDPATPVRSVSRPTVTVVGVTPGALAVRTGAAVVAAPWAVLDGAADVEDEVGFADEEQLAPASATTDTMAPAKTGLNLNPIPSPWSSEPPRATGLSRHRAACVNCRSLSHRRLVKGRCAHGRACRR
jgi:hypothetical protein